LLSGLSTGVKHASRLSAIAISSVLTAAQTEPFVCEPLDRMGRTNRSEAALDALEHEVADHFAGCTEIDIA